MKKRLEALLYDYPFLMFLPPVGGVLIVAALVLPGDQALASLVGGGMIGGPVAYIVLDRERKKHARDFDSGLLAIPKGPRPVYCSSCGTRMIEWKKQTGFNTKTGEPSYEMLPACPQWNGETDYDRKMKLAAHSGLSSSIFDYRTAPPSSYPCSNVVRGAWTPDLEHAHPATEVSLSCARCVLDMEQAGILNKKEANEAMAKIHGTTE